MFSSRAGTIPIDIRLPKMDRFPFATVQKIPPFPLAGLQNFVLKNAKCAFFLIKISNDGVSSGNNPVLSGHGFHLHAGPFCIRAKQTARASMILILCLPV